MRPPRFAVEYVDRRIRIRQRFRQASMRPPQFAVEYEKLPLHGGGVAQASMRPPQFAVEYPRYNARPAMVPAPLQ